MGADSDAYSAVVNASKDDIVAALLDFDSYTDWQSGMLECTVKERDEQGRGSVVELYVDAKVKKIRYLTKYYYDLDNGILGWEYVSGDLKECTGRYELTAQDDGTTNVSVNIDTEIGFFVPGPMKKLIRDQSLKNSMRDLKKRVEK
ncbi:MAG: SRPBCC family protein [Jatrophihabitantaceae bacterium]